MLELDGSHGGGQLLRSSLALSALTETPIRLSGIRGSRPDPGLKHQHLAALETIAAVCNASVEGAALGSETVTFRPGTPTGGSLDVDVGTAGSVTLVFETLVSLASALDEPLAVTATGGTEVKWSPPLSTYRTVTLPLYRSVGLQVAIERHRTGFYPAGGGEATLHLAPSTLSPVRLTERGEFRQARVYSRESVHIAESTVAKRQADAARTALEAAGLGVGETTTATAETDSPGSAVTVALEYEHTRAGFDSLGERGKPAEDVAQEATDRARAFHETAAVVDRHVADQFLLTLALAGGTLHIPEVTDHVETSLTLLEQFGFDLECSITDDVVVVTAD